jgi:hypothetical protein
MNVCHCLTLNLRSSTCRQSRQPMCSTYGQAAGLICASRCTSRSFTIQVLVRDPASGCSLEAEALRQENAEPVRARLHGTPIFLSTHARNRTHQGARLLVCVLILLSFLFSSYVLPIPIASCSTTSRLQLETQDEYDIRVPTTVLPPSPHPSFPFSFPICYSSSRALGQTLTETTLPPRGSRTPSFPSRP